MDEFQILSQLITNIMVCDMEVLYIFFQHIFQQFTKGCQLYFEFNLFVNHFQIGIFLYAKMYWEWNV